MKLDHHSLLSHKLTEKIDNITALVWCRANDSPAPTEWTNNSFTVLLWHYGGLNKILEVNSE